MLPTVSQLEKNLYDSSKEGWAAYTYMKYSQNREVIKAVWSSLDEKLQDQIRTIRKHEG